MAWCNDNMQGSQCSHYMGVFLYTSISNLYVSAAVKGDNLSLRNRNKFLDDLWRKIRINNTKNILIISNAFINDICHEFRYNFKIRNIGIIYISCE